jgi:hypothetical protein
MRYLRAALVLVAIGLVSASPNTAPAFEFGTRATCRNLFFEQLRPEVKVESIRSTRQTSGNWVESFRSLKNRSDFYKLLNDLSAKANGNQLSQLAIETLHKLDLVEVISRFSEEDIQHVATVVREAKARVRASKEWGVVDRWLIPLDYHFEPRGALEFVRDLPKYSTFGKNGQVLSGVYGGRYGLSPVNATLKRVFRDLPGDVRAEAVKELKAQYEKINLRAEIASGSGSEADAAFRVRKHRRNIENLVSWMYRKEFETLIDGVGRARNHDSMLEAIHGYFILINSIFGPNRGHYSFTRVMDAAVIMSETFAPFLNTTNHYLDIYGSFVNGKATFAISDVDFKLSHDLLMYVTGQSWEKIEKDKFTQLFSDVRAVATDKARFDQFWNLFVTAEKQLARKIFLREVEKPSDLLTTVYPPPDYTNDAWDMRWYNPLTIRIYRDRTYLVIADLANENPVLIQIPLDF